MNENNFSVKINGKSIRIPDWRVSNDTEKRQSSSNLTRPLNAVTDEKKKCVKLDDTRKRDALIKISDRIRTSVFVIITIIALGILTQQGIICISK